MSGAGRAGWVLGWFRRLNAIWEDIRWEADRGNAVFGIRFPDGCEQRFSCKDQIARSFNGIEGLQRGILEFICAGERAIH